jgi:hypothetical protein
VARPGNCGGHNFYRINWSEAVKKINTPRRTSGKGLGLMAKTGFHCPANGFWRPEDRSGDLVFVFEGSIMPASRGGSTVWYLEDAAFGPPEYPLPAR